MLGKNNYTFEKVLEEVNKIFQDVLDNDNIIVTSETTSASIPEWDSLGHIQLVIAIEKHFAIQFTALEIQNYKNVGEMCKDILRKLKIDEKK